MTVISKELEDKILKLIKESEPIDAVALVQKELQLGLRISKEIVDKYRN